LSGRVDKRRWEIKEKSTATLGRVNGFNPATEKKFPPASLDKREGIRGQGRGEWFKGGGQWCGKVVMQKWWWKAD